MTASLRGLPACNTEACGLSRLKNHSALLVRQSGAPDDHHLHVFCTHSGLKRAEQGCQSFVVGDDAEYAFACTMISLWEGARA